MTMSRTEAEEALSEIQRTTGRSYTLRAYHGGAPILLLWGVIWIAGYAGMGLAPPGYWWMIWGPLDVIGLGGTFLMAARLQRGSGDAKGGWRMLGAALAIGVFYGAVLSLFQPTTPNAYLAFPGVLTGAIYTMIGVWRMARYVWIGAALTAATLIGFFAFPTVLPFWMAAAGGAALILGGLWLRRA